MNYIISFNLNFKIFSVFGVDFEKATKWLNEQAQKEGWSKAEKLKNRTTSQGTLVFVNDKTLHRASIIEVNI